MTAIGCQGGKSHDSPVLGATSAIEVLKLVREYKARGTIRRALQGISFGVGYGEIVGLLGPNGAGKTSCVRVLATLLSPTSGSATVAGADVVRQPRQVQRQCGLSFGGDGGLYQRLSSLDNLRFFGTMYGMHGKALLSRAGQMLEAVGLADRAGDRVETFSRGMRQRLHIARALLHDPHVLLLDEPSSGLDPENARALRELIRRYRDEGRAILLTTHDLAEAEAICDRILILLNGQIARSATPSELRAEAAQSLGTIVEFQTYNQVPNAIFEAWPGLIEWSEQGGSYRIRCHDASRGAAFVLESLQDKISGLQIAAPTLEEAYLEVLR